MKETIVWILTLESEQAGYDWQDCCPVIIGVYSTWDKAQQHAENSELAMNSPEGITWRRDDTLFVGELESYYNALYPETDERKRLNEWTYKICSRYLDGIISTWIAPAEMEQS